MIRKPSKEMTDEAIQPLGIARRQSSAQRGQDPQGCLLLEDHQDHYGKKGECHQQKQHAGADKPRRERYEKEHENRDDQNRQAVENPLDDDRAECGTHFEAAFFRDEIGAGQLSQARGDGDDREKTRRW